MSATPPHAGEDWSRAGWRAHLPGVPDAGEYTQKLGEATIPGLAAASADQVPDRHAVIIDGVPVTHGGLHAGAARIAGWLARRLAPGDRVLLAAGASIGFLRCYLGALRAGAVVVLANPGYTATELAHVATDSGALIAFADPGPARLLAGLPRPPLTVDVRAIPSSSARPAGAEPKPGPDDIALLAYTSGTTGRPKGVPLTHRQLVTSIRAAMAAWRWDPGERAVHALPLFHQHGLGIVHAALIAGSTIHIRSAFTPAGLVQAVRTARAGMLFAVPAMYQALLDELAPRAVAGTGTRCPALEPPGQASRETAATPLAGLRLAVCGSAPLSPGLAARLPALLGRLPLVRYGTTESGLDVSHVVGASRADTVGVPLPGVLARIWAVAGQDEPGSQTREGMGDPAGPQAVTGHARGGEALPGVDGEIQLRGPQVFSGYWNDPAATRAAFTADGWFRTGDIGRVDPVTGHLMIRGRIKEMIITGGLNVYPREIEMVLESHPSVTEAAVAGVPHRHWGEQVTAWVVIRPGFGFDETALIAHARASLAGYKCPKRVLHVAGLPRNHVGKIARAALVAEWGGRQG